MDLLLSWLITGLHIYHWIMIAYIIISWFPEYHRHPFTQALGRLVDPFVDVFRSWIPPIGGIDFSTLIALLVLIMATRGLGNL